MDNTANYKCILTSHQQRDMKFQCQSSGTGSGPPVDQAEGEKARGDHLMQGEGHNYVDQVEGEV